MSKDKQFAVIVRFEGENPANQYPPLVYWHNSPRAAARRLAALINRRASWVPSRVAVGTRFYIADHGIDNGKQFPLRGFKLHYGIK